MAAARPSARPSFRRSCPETTDRPQGICAGSVSCPSGHHSVKPTHQADGNHCLLGVFHLLPASGLASYAVLMNTKHKEKSKKSNTPVAAFRTKAGLIGEMILQADIAQTAFAVGGDGTVKENVRWLDDAGSTLVPISGDNNLLRHRAVLLPEKAEECGTVDDLIEAIGAYFDRYVCLSPDFRVITIHYVLLTWVYDAFNELPYLRFRGEPGSGKTRALIIIGSICHRAFLASGASTVSPIFHTLDTFRGTFIFDEADFRFSDEKMELVKILNNGNVRGFPVFRSVATPQKQFNPQAFHVFGPKIVAMRHAFEDKALESRFLTEEMGQRRPTLNIPINLPDEQSEEALVLRNQLLMYRFRYLGETRVHPEFLDRTLSPRMCQILSPLLSVAHDEAARAVMLKVARVTEQRHQSERGQLPEAQLLAVICGLTKQGKSALPLATITATFMDLVGDDFSRPITPRYIGSLLRNRLHLLPYKTGGVFVLPPSEVKKARALAAGYGLAG